MYLFLQISTLEDSWDMGDDVGRPSPLTWELTCTDTASCILQRSEGSPVDMDDSRALTFEDEGILPAAPFNIIAK